MALFGLRTWPAIRTSAAVFVQMLMLPKGGAGFSRPHVHTVPLYTTVLSGTWWVGTGDKFDPDNPHGPDQAWLVCHALWQSRAHWDGAKDEDVTLPDPSAKAR